MGLRNAFIATFASLPAIQAAIPGISGFSLTWGDDFNGISGSLPNLNNWIVDTGTSYPGGPANWGNGEAQTYTSSVNNLRLDGQGNLQIVALKDSAGKWTSGRIETKRTDFVCKPGKKMRIQASLNLPNVGSQGSAGYWPAFWALGSAYRGNYQNWPTIGEWDIMENINGVNTVYANYHCGTASGGPCNEPNGLSGTRACPNNACQGNWHTYTFEVDRTQSLEAIRWFVDGTLFWQVTSNNVPAATWNATTYNGHFLLLNLAMGGSFPNAVYGSSTPNAATVSGGVYQVAYIAVYNS